MKVIGEIQLQRFKYSYFFKTTLRCLLSSNNVNTLHFMIYKHQFSNSQKDTETGEQRNALRAENSQKNRCTIDF